MPQGGVGGVAVAPFVESGKLVDDGCPNRGRSRYRNCNRLFVHRIVGSQRLLRDFFWHLFFLCLVLCLRQGYFSIDLELYRCGRRAILVVASTITQITFHDVLATQELHFLGEGGCLFEVIYVCAKHLLKLLDGCTWMS